MPVPAGVWARLEIYFSGAQKNWSNIFWYTGAGSFPSNYNQATFAAAFLTQMQAPLCAPMDSTLLSLGCYCVVNNGSGSFGVKKYTNLQGQDGSTYPMPEDVAVVVQRISDTAGKSGRGRLYLSGWSQSQCTGSYLNGTGYTSGVAIQTAMKAPIVDQGITWSPAVHSKTTNSLHAMVNALAVSLLGTSRRRRATF